MQDKKEKIVDKTFSVQRVTLGLILIVAILSLVVGRMVFASGEVFTSPTNKTVYEHQSLPITDLQVNGTGNDTLSMNLYASNGSLQFNTDNGLIYDGPEFGQSLKFSGSRSDINVALSTLRYVSEDPGTHTIEAALGDGNYWAENGHVYKVVADSGISWQDAKVAAENAEYGGVNGYLATVTSQGEHDFILERINDSGWIGANDITSEGVWRWQTGPEAGTQFWSGDSEGGSPFGGAFTNWNSGEPNNSGEGEDCGQIWFTQGSNGQWNDLNCESDENEYYVVEFGAPGHLPAIANRQFSVTVNAAPEIAFTNLVPADDSEVTPTDTLSITYNQPMETSEGYLRIYNAADDSEVMELGTYDGTTEDGLTFVYELPNKLEAGNDYYVHITEWGMEGIVDYYDGFEDKTTWNFTVVDNLTPNGGDANDDGIVDRTQDNVGGYTNSYTGKYVAIDVGSDCELIADDITRETNFDIQDAAYEYDNGLWEFEADCGTPGFTTTISLYYYGISADGLVVRKHNPVTGAYFTLNDAEISMTTIGGQNVVVVSYQITDGGERDVDATENGEIVDPVGLARMTVGVPNTGLGGRFAR